MLENKKAGVRTKIRTKSGFVPKTGLLSNHFIEDLRRIAALSS